MRRGSCTAVVGAGNTGTGSFAVTVRGAGDQLGELLDAVAGVGPGESLAAKIRAAVDALSDGFPSAACDSLGAFISAVEAQAGRHVPAGHAATLVEDATRIRAVLACP